MDRTPWWNPYLAGVALGLVLLATFLVMGFGLGASGAMGRVGIFAIHSVAPEAVEGHAFFSTYVGPGKRVLDDWLVYEVLGVLLGGAFAAYTAGRLRRSVQGGLDVPAGRRLVMALMGGVLMGVAARFAHGCTSGQALTGGALLSLGSWVFMMAVFAGGYAVAPVVRRFWQ